MHSLRETYEITYELFSGKKIKVKNIPKAVDKDEVRRTVTKQLDRLVAIEFPTSLTCNLRCKYCYIRKPSMKVTQVPAETMLKVFNEVTTYWLPAWQHPEREVALSPWGAEPLCNLDTLEACVEFLLRIKSKHPRKRVYLGTSTNGTIWNSRVEQLFEKIIDHNLMRDIQISLDGPKYVQDYGRPFADGRGSFDAVENFTKQFIELCQRKRVRPFHHFCSTIYVHDTNFVQMWLDSVDFFTTPNRWYTQMHLPMRASHSMSWSEDDTQRFVEAIKQSTELLLEKSQKLGMPLYDFYSAKLFNGSPSLRSSNACPFCSAMRSQVGLDVDGSVYMCHGPITSPELQEWYRWANVLEGWIDYRALVRNLEFMFGTNWIRARCHNCPIRQHPWVTGIICYLCPPGLMHLHLGDMVLPIEQCRAYQEAFPYWLNLVREYRKRGWFLA